MNHHLTRQELYDLVWSEPIKKLAPRFGLSDVALAKACRRADVPVPQRGYWAQLQAGKTLIKCPLPARGLGMSDSLSIDDKRNETHDQLVSRLLSQPILPPPSFPEDLVDVTDRVRKMVGKVSVPHASMRLHPLVARLVDEDERRRKAEQSSSYSLLSGTPLFDAPVERRRLRVLNTVFLALQRCGTRPWIRDRQGRETGVEVGQQNVAFTVEPVAERRPGPLLRPCTDGKPGREKLRLTIGSREAAPRGKSWEDSADDRIEDHLTEIAVEIIVTGEVNYREGAREAHAWWLQRRTQLQEQVRRENEEAGRRESERLAKIEKERIEYLLTEAENWRRAADLRAFVEAVRAAKEAKDSEDPETLERWAASVLALADQIDPIRAGRIPNENPEN